MVKGGFIYEKNTNGHYISYANCSSIWNCCLWADNSSRSDNLMKDIERTDKYVHEQIDSAIQEEISLAKKLKRDLLKTNKNADVIRLKLSALNLLI